MLLVYLSIGILVVSIILLSVAFISFRKKTNPTLSYINSVSERLQEENNAIQEQVDQLKSKQEAIKNDMDWKKSVFTFTVAEMKKLPNVFKSSSKQKLHEYERGM
ncbi:hypothetical protein [Sutcliffiella horikoshii]|uniref:DUF948 domain-containing protein n=1 Tax=Sutcliffiella horikoshii TaxID=79883 RepID=A0AA94WNL3_9BACI|nr:hypothetical protein [Sutcliffiella horikoshii]TYS57855.1 hypothetical protein FZC74_15650 [Sutcliffiella horikoshii]